MKAFSIFLIVTGVTLQIHALQAMLEEPTELVLNQKIAAVSRTQFIHTPTIIYDATISDGTTIMAYLITAGHQKGVVGIKYRDQEEKKDTPLHPATPTFLYRLYPSLSEDNDTNEARIALHEHLLLTLEAEYIKQNPSEPMLLISKK